MTNINLNQESYENILKYLIYPKEKNGLGLNVKKTTYLDILIKSSDIRVTITNENDIKKYWLLDNLDDVEHNIIKKNNIYNYNLDNYSIKFSLSSEVNIPSEKFNTNNLNSKEKIFRYKNRYEIYTKDNLFRIDLTELRQSESINLKNSNIFKSPLIYEIELEYIGHIKNLDNIIKCLINNLNILVTLFQKSFYIITNKEYNSVISFYTNLVKSKYYIAANPITLQFNNLENKSNSIIKNYSVTYKADGERNFIVVLSSIDKKCDGNIYLLNNNLIVKNTGLNCKKWAGSLLEAEYIKEKNIILLYDILFYKKKDIRNLSLLKSKDNRYNYIDLFLKDIDGNDKYRFEGKNYYYESDTIFEDCKILLNKKQDYPIDGLIFTPVNMPYPKNKCDNIFKWKPPLYNSIDFLIEIEKENGIEKKIPISYKRISDSLSRIYQCKIIKLKVSGFREKLNKNNNNREKICVPVDFKYKNISYIPIVDDNIYALDKENNTKVPIKDDQIVEFIYDTNEKNEEFRWKPIRIRFDKTLKYKNGENMFGNFETVANDIWNSIMNPITEEILSTGEFTNPNINKKEEYYNSESYNNNKKNRLSYQKFHSGYVKYNLLKTTVSLIEDKDNIRLLDIGYGKLGDMTNWKRNKINFIFGIDNNESNFDLSINIYDETPLPKPELILTFGDFSKLIYPDFNAANDEISIELMKKYLINKNSFDIVSSQFSLSYFWDSEIMIRSLIQNVSDSLKIGGYFIGTCFNSRRVLELLQGKKEVKKSMGDKVIWSIKKLYRSFKYNTDKPNFNKKIEIYIKSIGKSIEENLVNMDYMIKLCSEYKLEIVKNEDFSKLFEDMSKNSNYKNIYSNFTNSEKEFSFLNDMFIFKKTEPSPTILLTKLLKKINK